MGETRSDSEVQKRMRWDGRSRPHYEVWYTTVSQLSSGAGFWIRYALAAPLGGSPRAEIWFSSFLPGRSETNVAVAQRYGLEQFSAKEDPFQVRIGACALESGRMTGMLDAGGVPVVWDLVYESVTDSLRYFPEVLYRLRWTRTKLLTPHPFMSLGGKIQIGERTFFLNNDPGQQGHVWGRSHADEWIWFHCSSFVTKEGEPLPGYVTGVTARPRLVGPVLLPAMSFGHLVWNEDHVPLQPASDWQQRWDGPWEWKSRLRNQEIAVRVSVPWTEMLLAEYHDPLGHSVFCHHTERADCVLQFREPRQPTSIYKATAAAHIEIGSRRADPRVERKVLLQD